MLVTRASPALQKINAILHTEPIATIVWGMYWILFFTIAPVIVVPFLLIVTIVQLVLQYFNRNNTTSPIYNPNQLPEYDMAIVVTGCDTGFGKEIAIAAADSGYTVFAGCLNLQQSKQQFETIRTIIPFQCDVTNDNDCSNASTLVEKWIKDTSVPIKDIGRKRYLFAIINNAGVDIPGETDTSNLSDFQFHMDVNFFGQIRIVKSFLPLLKEQAIHGSSSTSSSCIPMRILNVSSMAGIVNGGIEKNPYHCSKHAVQSFTMNLRVELAPFNIIVSSINPSFHATPIVEMMDQATNDRYTNLPQHLKDQYGEEYRTKLKDGTSKYIVWNSNVVVEQILQKGLFVKYPMAEIIIGTDAKFILSSFGRLFPPYIWQPLVQLERPLPACMKKKRM